MKDILAINKAYIKAVELAMITLDEIEKADDAKKALSICKEAFEKISPCRIDKYYKARGGKFSGLGTLDNIAEDYVAANDFEEITKEEFEAEED